MPSQMRYIRPFTSPAPSSSGWPLLLSLLIFWAAMTVSGIVSAQTTPDAKMRAIELFRAAEGPFRYEGRVEASQRAIVPTHRDGIVETIYFKGGEIVKEGDLLISLDQTDEKLALQAAEADLLRAKARATLAKQDIERIKELMKREIAPLQRRQQAEAELAIARADLASAEILVKRAEANLARTEIRAPIAGRISRPRVAVGAFIKAEKKTYLADIQQTDRVVVAYDVPYAERLTAFGLAELEHFEDMLSLVTLRLEIAGQVVLPETAKPEHVTTGLNDAGAITICAIFDNPKRLLRPGLRVQVLSELDEEAVQALAAE